MEVVDFTELARMADWIAVASFRKSSSSEPERNSVARVLMRLSTVR